MAEIILVDGVGNGVLYERQADSVKVTIRPPRSHSRVVFIRTSEIMDEREVYRLSGTDRGLDSPKIRRINKSLISTTD